MNRGPRIITRRAGRPTVSPEDGWSYSSCCCRITDQHSTAGTAPDDFDVTKRHNAVPVRCSAWLSAALFDLLFFFLRAIGGRCKRLTPRTLAGKSEPI